MGETINSLAEAHFTETAVRPGELAAILIDLLDNAVAGLRSDAARTGIGMVRAAIACHDTAVTKSGGLGRWRRQAVEAYVKANLEQKITLVLLADAVNLSPSYFSVAFKKSFGATPYSYVIDRRIERAQQMMLTTKEPLSQISFACGFGDQAHLSNLFRRRTGFTPNTWRRVFVREAINQTRS
jgi:AraC family transcriptional regulator